MAGTGDATLSLSACNWMTWNNPIVCLSSVSLTTWLLWLFWFTAWWVNTWMQMYERKHEFTWKWTWTWMRMWKWMVILGFCKMVIICADCACAVRKDGTCQCKRCLGYGEGETSICRTRVRDTQWTARKRESNFWEGVSTYLYMWYDIILPLTVYLCRAIL